MRHRPTIPLTPEDKAVCARWSRRVLGIWTLIVIATVLLPIFRSDSVSVSREQAWDRSAAMR
jgi:hypothetical protein